tara:strand:+ start:412 stop:666 length:255 start_codon:yes stop_codon:yes gene_type:complete
MDTLELSPREQSLYKLVEEWVEQFPDINMTLKSAPEEIKKQGQSVVMTFSPCEDIDEAVLSGFLTGVAEITEDHRDDWNSNNNI